MPLEIALRCLDEAHSLGLKVVTLIGGEPLIYPELLPLLDWFDDHPEIAIEFETNGILLHRYAERLAELPNDFCVGISVDGVALRGEEATQRALSALQIPIGKGSKYVQTLCCYDNIDADFLNICERVAVLGLDHVIFPGPSGCGRGKDHSYLKWEDCKRMINAVNERGWTNVRFELPSLITGDFNYGCGWCTVRCEVMPNGDVTPCAQAYYEDSALTVGNIHQQSLAEIWHGSAGLSGLRSIKQSDMKGACSTCGHWEGCFGACRSWARSWDDEQSWKGAYLRCDEFLADAVPPVKVPFKKVHLLKFKWVEGMHVAE